VRRFSKRHSEKDAGWKAGTPGSGNQLLDAPGMRARFDSNIQGYYNIQGGLKTASFD